MHAPGRVGKGRTITRTWLRWRHLLRRVQQRVRLRESLSALDKVKQLRETSSAVDQQIMPLLNAEQQPKFLEMRDRLRRRIIEKAGTELMEKIETRVEGAGPK